MKKVMCAKCGGSTKPKMAKGGSMQTTVGKAVPKGQMYGIPQTGSTGPNYQGVDTMKKGGMVRKKKLAALAPPTNKVTRADVIAGALKNKRKKK